MEKDLKEEADHGAVGEEGDGDDKGYAIYDIHNMLTCRAGCEVVGSLLFLAQARAAAPKEQRRRRKGGREGVCVFVCAHQGVL